MTQGFEYLGTQLILDYDEYWFELDEYRRGDECMYFAHIAFEKFTPAIYKKVLREWLAFRLSVRFPLYAICDDGDPRKWEHFVRNLGFRATGINVPCNNGVVRQLFISTVSHEHVNTTDPKLEHEQLSSVVCATGQCAQPSVPSGN